MRPRLLGLAQRLGPILFRHRDALVPVLALVLIGASRRQDFLLTAALDPWFAAFGIVLIVLGLGLRLVVIATAPIRRSGVHKDLAVPTLLETGPYACCRNPLYLANAMILVGVAAIFDSRATWLVALPGVLVALRSLVAAEERVLRERFGVRYDDYVARVPRFVPRRLSFTPATRPRWWRALRKEHDTIFAAASAVAVLLAVEHLRRFGTIGHRHGWMLIAAWAGTAAVWAGIRHLKLAGRLADVR